MLREIIRSFVKFLKLAKFRTKWCKKNKHNFTRPNNIFPFDVVKVGRYTYADLNVYSYRNKREKLVIGDFCSIASDVIFVLSGEHSSNFMSTYPFIEKIYGDSVAAQCKGPIIVGDDVWIGVRCTILSGVTIGQGAIIGANSIVSKDVPPYSIYVGNKVIKKRFDDQIIDKLLRIDYSKFSDEHINCFHKYCATSITVDNVDEIVKYFPKKLDKE